MILGSHENRIEWKKIVKHIRIVKDNMKLDAAIPDGKGEDIASYYVRRQETLVKRQKKQAQRITLEQLPVSDKIRHSVSRAPNDR